MTTKVQGRHRGLRAAIEIAQDRPMHKNST